LHCWGHDEDRVGVPAIAVIGADRQILFSTV